MNALTLVFAALCLFAIGYRFYGLFFAKKVLGVSDARLTPAVTMLEGYFCAGDVFKQLLGKNTQGRQTLESLVNCQKLFLKR